MERQCLLIAKEEGINDMMNLQHLQIAALYHDTGFLFTYKGHEEKSCELAKEQLPALGADLNTIKNVCQLILATKIPHHTKNVLEQVICDADLDYLGREDYFIINEKLHKEFLEYGIINNDNDEWGKSRTYFL